MVIETAEDVRRGSERVRDLDQLADLFRSWETGRASWRVGVETERFGVDLATGRPLHYQGPGGILSLFDRLQAFGWQPQRETPTGPVIALERDGASITLEPGAQFELSGKPFVELHGVAAETAQHLAELRHAARGEHLGWLGIGFHPTARLDDFDAVPKRRYTIMREYLPTRGTRALDMMWRTAALQVNLDFSNEHDALQKLLVSLKLVPILIALTANSPFLEGRRSSRLSERGDVWFHMDPDRSGLIAPLWGKPNPSYLDYVGWAVACPMFLFTRGERVFRNTGQRFRDFMRDGFEGERATIADFKAHLNTLFPEARLKRTLEIRPCDSQSARFVTAIPALLVGLLYDQRSLAAAAELVAPWAFAEVEQAQRDAGIRGLQAKLGRESLLSLAERVIDWARAGLERRAIAGPGVSSEAAYLAPLADVVGRGMTPAEQLLEKINSPEADAKSLLRQIAAADSPPWSPPAA